MSPPTATALISITGPARDEAILRDGWHSVLRLSFDDVEPVTFPGQDRHLRALSSLPFTPLP